MVAALFANDGAALILTPIVIAMLLALGFSRGATLAFIMAAGFIADTASLPLIVSNLVNIVSADFFKLGFSEYAAVMVPVNPAAIAATLVMLHLFFRKDIPAVYDVSLLKEPKDAIRDVNTFKTGWLVLVLLLVGFFGLEPLGVPVSLVAAAGALLLFAVAKKGMPLTPVRCCVVRPGKSLSSRWGCTGGLRLTKCRSDPLSLFLAESAGRAGIVGGNAGYGLPDGLPVISDEQYADRAGRGAVD